MKSLQAKSAAIFFNLMERLDKKESKKFTSPYYMPLTLHIIGKLNTGFGDGDTYFLGHHFKKNGKVMLAPGMLFLVMKNNIFNNLPDQIFPYGYRNDPLKTFEESIVFEEGGTLSLDVTLQEKHAEIAERWMKMIQVRKYLS